VAVCPETCLKIQDVEPVLDGDCSDCGACVDSCPGETLPMGRMGQVAFNNKRGSGEELGFFRSLWAGYSRDQAVREAGTSGGLVTQLITDMMENGEIDAALVTGFCENHPWRARPVVVHTPAGVRAHAQSKYTMSAQNAALRDLGKKERVALVGLPCQIAGLRKAQAGGWGLEPDIVLAIGLFCLSNFLPEGTEYMIREVFGVNLEDVERVAYREGEFPGSIVVESKDGSRKSLPYPEAKQHLRPFRPYRCMVCYDWSSELADVSVGDLWSDPEREAHSCAVARSRRGEEILLSAGSAETIHLERIQAHLVTDNPGFRYKKRGNAAFIRHVRQHGLPCPDYPGVTCS